MEAIDSFNVSNRLKLAFDFFRLLANNALVRAVDAAEGVS